MDPTTITQEFLELYGGEEKPRCFFAPGRVNLIGEHTDYNNGFVLPCALSFGTYLAIRPTQDGLLRFASLNFTHKAVIPAGGPYAATGGDWTNYPLGVLEMFRQKGLYTGGFEMLFAGDISPTAGLSSRASIEMVTAFTMNEIHGWGHSTFDLIHLSKKAENEFVGVNCGIMDQFAVGKGKEGAAIFLNCGTLQFNPVPVNLPGYRLVIGNTNKKRGLADSKYNERVAECRQAVEAMGKETGFKSLSDYSPEDFETYSCAIADETILRRARHVVTENRRVLEAVKALWNSDLEAFASLLNASHDSLKDDYEVTGNELDTMVYAAREFPATLCSRMTGAGFGGCTVSFVKSGEVDAFMRETAAKYTTKTGIVPEFYLPEIGDGMRELTS